MRVMEVLYNQALNPYLNEDPRFNALDHINHIKSHQTKLFAGFTFAGSLLGLSAIGVREGIDKYLKTKYGVELPPFIRDLPLTAVEVVGIGLRYKGTRNRNKAIEGLRYLAGTK